MSAHRKARERALAEYKNRLDKMTNPDHSKRKQEYNGVENPKGRAHIELRVVIRDFLAFGYTREAVIRELDDILEG